MKKFLVRENLNEDFKMEYITNKFDSEKICEEVTLVKTFKNEDYIKEFIEKEEEFQSNYLINVYQNLKFENKYYITLEETNILYKSNINMVEFSGTKNNIEKMLNIKL